MKWEMVRAITQFRGHVTTKIKVTYRWDVLVHAPFPLCCSAHTPRSMSSILQTWDLSVLRRMPVPPSTPCPASRGSTHSTGVISEATPTFVLPLLSVHWCRGFPVIGWRRGLCPLTPTPLGPVGGNHPATPTPVPLPTYHRHVGVAGTYGGVGGEVNTMNE